MSLHFAVCVPQWATNSPGNHALYGVSGTASLECQVCLPCLLIGSSPKEALGKAVVSAAGWPGRLAQYWRCPLCCAVFGCVWVCAVVDEPARRYFGGS